jgi:hypothetical protein
VPSPLRSGSRNTVKRIAGIGTPAHGQHVLMSMAEHALTLSATEVGRFVEEAHLWTSKDLPRDVARFWTTQSGCRGRKALASCTPGPPQTLSGFLSCHKPTESLFLGTPFTLRVRIRWYSPPTRGRYALHVGKIRPDLDGSVRRPRVLCAHHPPLKMLGSCSSEFYGWLSLPSWRLESTIRCRLLVFLSKMPLLLTMSSCRLSFCAALRRL